MLENMLDLLTDVQTQMPQSLGPLHRYWAFHPLDIVQAGIREGFWKLYGRAISTLIRNNSGQKIKLTGRTNHAFPIITAPFGI